MTFGSDISKSVVSGASLALGADSNIPGFRYCVRAGLFPYRVRMRWCHKPDFVGLVGLVIGNRCRDCDQKSGGPPAGGTGRQTSPIAPAAFRLPGRLPQRPASAWQPPPCPAFRLWPASRMWPASIPGPGPVRLGRFQGGAGSVRRPDRWWALNQWGTRLRTPAPVTT